MYNRYISQLMRIITTILFVLFLGINSAFAIASDNCPISPLNRCDPMSETNCITTVLIPVTLPGALDASGAHVEIYETANPQDPIECGQAWPAFMSNYMYEGSYLIKIIPENSPDMVDNGLYEGVTLPVFISKTDTEYDSMSETYTFSDVMLSLATRYIEVTVTDTDNNLLVGANVFASETMGTPPDQRNSYTNSSGIAYIAIPPSNTAKWNVSIGQAGYGTSSTLVTPVADPGITHLSKQLTAVNANVTVELKAPDANGNPVTFPFPSFPSDLYGEVYCIDVNTDSYFSMTLMPGDTEAIFSVVAGSLTCGAYIEGESASTQNVSVGIGENQVVQSLVYSVGANATVTLQFRTAEGNPYPLPHNSDDYYGYVYCQDVEGENYFQEFLAEGDTQKSIDVLAGDYECSAIVNGESVGSQFVTVNQADTVFIDTIFYSATANANITVRLTVPDGLGGRVPYASPPNTDSFYGEVTCQNLNENYFAQAFLAEGDTEKTIGVVDGQYECTVYLYDAQASYESVAVGIGETSAVDVLVYANLKNATINVQLKVFDGEGNLVQFNIPDDPNIFGDVFCDSKNGFYHYGEQIFPGESEKSLTVTAGTYECGAFISGLPSGFATVTAAENETTNVTSLVLTRNAEVTIRIVDEANPTVPLQGAEAYFGVETVYDENTDFTMYDSGYEQTNQGFFTFQAVSGMKYQAFVDVFSDPAANPVDAVGVITVNGKNYAVPNELVEFTPMAGSPLTVDIPLSPLTSLAEVTLRDIDDSVVQQGFAVAYTPGSVEATSLANPVVLSTHSMQAVAKSASSQEIFIGAPIIDGKAAIPLVAGREFRISAAKDVFTETDKVGSLTPRPVSVTLIDGETRAVELKVAAPNHQLTITISDAPEGYEAFCFAHNDYEQFVETGLMLPVNGSASATVNIYVDQDLIPWTISCEAFPVTSEQFEFKQVERDYVPTKSDPGASGTQNLSFSGVEADKYIPTTAYQFDPDNSSNFTLPDQETSIVIPASAVPSGANSVTMRVETPKGVKETKSNTVVDKVNVSFNAGDRKISKMDKPVTMTFKVTKAELAKLGALPTDIIGASYDPTTGTWKQDGDFSYDETTEVLTVKAKHFSVWGALIDRAKALQRQYPTELSASRSGSGSYVLSWTAPKAATDGQQYIVEFAKVPSAVDTAPVTEPSPTPSPTATPDLGSGDGNPGDDGSNIGDEDPIATPDPTEEEKPKKKKKKKRKKKKAGQSKNASGNKKVDSPKKKKRKKNRSKTQSRFMRVRLLSGVAVIAATDWSQSTRVEVAGSRVERKLEPGEYVFRVTVKVDNGKTSVEEHSFTVTQ